MSIRAMTWAFSLPLEPRAKLALLAIADNARDDGIAWPGRDVIAAKSSQSRSTVGRRLKALAELGVIAIKERFREDGTQTTDEIHLDLTLSPDDVLRKMHDSGETNEAEDGEEQGPAGEDAGQASHDADASGRGCQPDTLGVQSGHPTVAVVTGGGLQSGHPQDEPSLEPESPPNPPPGGPLSKQDKEAEQKRGVLWGRFAASYPDLARMDQQAARGEFDQLAIDDAEWAVGSLVSYKADLAKARVLPKPAHLWLRKGMFKNYQRGRSDAPAPSPDAVWIVEGSDQDRALRFVRSLARAVTPFVRLGSDGSRGYPHRAEVGLDLLAMLAFVNDTTPRWPLFARGSPEFAAWQSRFNAWIGRGLPCPPGEDGIRAPCQWPPKKDGKLYLPDEAAPEDDRDNNEEQSDG